MTDVLLAREYQVIEGPRIELEPEERSSPVPNFGWRARSSVAVGCLVFINIAKHRSTSIVSVSAHFG